jgi:hypothetical protein
MTALASAVLIAIFVNLSDLDVLPPTTRAAQERYVVRFKDRLKVPTAPREDAALPAAPLRYLFSFDQLE